MDSKRSRGFSLIEVVIVVVVVVVLLSLIVPAIAMSRQAMRQLLCGANMKKLGGASQMYAFDHDGYLPLNYVRVEDGSVKDWESLLEKYLGGHEVEPIASQKKLDVSLPGIHCPLVESKGHKNRMGYAMNSFESSRSWQAYSGTVIRQRELYLKLHPEMEYSKAYGWYRTPLRLADLVSPSKTYQFVDSDVRDLKVSDHRTAVGRHRHGTAGDWLGTLNMQFYDGHVSLYEKQGLKWKEPKSLHWLPYEGY